MNLYKPFKFLFRIIILFVFFIPAIPVIAQVVITNPSTTVQIIDNKKFYLHHVLQGQTLTSLARTYGVKVKDIMAENPGIEQGLKSGQILRIPYISGIVPGDPLLKSGNQTNTSGNNPLPKKNNEPVVNVVPASPEKPSAQSGKDNREVVKKEEKMSLKKEENKAGIPVKKEETVKKTTREVKPETLVNKKEILKKNIEEKENVSENKQEIIAYKEVTEKVSLLDTLAFQNFCNKKITSYFNDTASLNRFQIKEYFYFTIGREGQISFIKNEQTEYNKNTRFLTQDDQGKLKKLKFKPAKKKNDPVITRVPVGIQLDVKRDSLKIKIKKEKIRVYNRPLFVEYIKPENPYYSLILDKARKMESAKGRYSVIILNGEYALYDMEAKEYNPFDHKLSDLHRKQVLIITEFKKK